MQSIAPSSSINAIQSEDFNFNLLWLFCYGQ